MEQTLLDQLGMTQEELQELVVKRLADHIVGRQMWRDYDDEDGDDSAGERGGKRVPQLFVRKLQDATAEAIAAKVAEITEQQVAPLVDSMVDQVVIRKTNQYGHDVEPSKGLDEYVAKLAADYLQEQVNDKGEKPYSYNDGRMSRIMWMVDRSIRARIAQSMQAAVSDANAELAQSIQSAVIETLQRLTGAIKCNVACK